MWCILILLSKQCMTTGGGTGLDIFLIPFRGVLLMKCRVFLLGGKTKQHKQCLGCMYLFFLIAHLH